MAYLALLCGAGYSNFLIYEYTLYITFMHYTCIIIIQLLFFVIIPVSHINEHTLVQPHEPPLKPKYFWVNDNSEILISQLLNLYANSMHASFFSLLTRCALHLKFF